MQPEPSEDVKLIAFDYYDGATEGFAEGLLDNTDCYFILVAWSSDQDDRLFAVVKIERSVCKRVNYLLEQAQGTPESPVWIPRWEFSDASAEAEVIELISSCRTRLINEGILLLTQQIGHRAARTLEINSDLALKVSEVLMRGTPDDLALWRVN
ncbi:hypothetical protein [Pseudoxanthomonas putridarboris]|uniref:Uncharacterized protein n=1 Tax=Pseudoxanthomonas putridarboris TaxID=752605 RepID=A0ABU9J4Z0_9GAMM